MSRILLADDSPHAQRMGERLLRDEGHEVITVVDGDIVFARLPDVDPDILILDANLPLRDGYEIARFVKGSSFYRHAAVLLTGSIAEPVDENKARQAGADGMIHKPFELKALTALINPLVPVIAEKRDARPAGPPPPPPGEEPKFVSGVVESPVEIEPLTAGQSAVEGVRNAGGIARGSAEQVSGETPVLPAKPTEADRVRAAVTLALDAAFPKIVDEVTRQVLRALHTKQ